MREKERELFEKRKKKIVKIIIILIILSSLFLIVKSALQIEKISEEVSEIHKEIIIEKEENKEEERHERLLNCISFLESGDKKVVILDSNNKYSYGEYQLQRETIQDFYKRYQGIEITLQEAEEIAMNSIQSRELTKSMIVEYGLIDKWWNTKNKIIEGKCANFEADEINNYN